MGKIKFHKFVIFINFGFPVLFPFPSGAVWRSGKASALRPKGPWFESRTSAIHVPPAHPSVKRVPGQGLLVCLRAR